MTRSKFGPEVVWRQPDRLGPQAGRPPGSPRRFAVATGGHLLRDVPGHAERLTPTPGQFDEGRHDYRRGPPKRLRRVSGCGRRRADGRGASPCVSGVAFRDPAGLGCRTIGPEDKRAEAEEGQKRISDWIGHEVDAEGDQLAE